MAVCSLLTREGLPLYGLIAGTLAFVVTAWSPALGSRLTGLVMAGLLLFAPLLPFVLKPLAIGLFGPKAPVVASLDAWRQIVLSEPLRLADRARPGNRPARPLLRPDPADRAVHAPVRDLVRARAGGRRGGQHHSLSGRHPGENPARHRGARHHGGLRRTFALGCLGIGTAQVWWFTTLVVLVLIFVAIERGQFRTKRPKAVLRRQV